MIVIDIKVDITQESASGKTTETDQQATLTTLGLMKRLTYKETSGAVTTLDFDSERVLLNREGSWKTQAIFSLLEPSNLKLITEEGVLHFEVNVLDLKVKDYEIYLHYQLLQNQAIMDSHIFRCVWTKEEESWLKTH